jgi:hypothetical protein
MMMRNLERKGGRRSWAAGNCNFVDLMFGLVWTVFFVDLTKRACCCASRLHLLYFHGPLPNRHGPFPCRSHGDGPHVQVGQGPPEVQRGSIWGAPCSKDQESKQSCPRRRDQAGATIGKNSLEVHRRSGLHISFHYILRHRHAAKFVFGGCRSCTSPSLGGFCRYITSLL